MGGAAGIGVGLLALHGLTLAQIDDHGEATDESRRTGHPGVCRTHSAAGLRALGASLSLLPAAAAAAVRPEGLAYDGNRFNQTATAPLFSYLAPSESADERVVS